MNTARLNRAMTAAALALGAALAGCDRNASDATTAAPDNAVVSVPLGTFAAVPSARVETGFDSRLPAAPEHTILVPATTLFPGMQRIAPNIENPYGDADGIRAGERHFAAFNCGGCHAPLGGGGMGPPLSDDVWIYGGEPAQIFLSIMHGRAEGMPAWSSMLPGRTVWELVAYIESLADIDDYAQANGFERRPPSGAWSPNPRNEPTTQTVAR